MLEIEMSKDIKNFEPKIIGPFTLRQIICTLIAMTYGIPLYFILGGDIVVRIMITLFAMVPAFLCGWLKVYNEPFEKFIKIVVKNKFLKPVKRKYKIAGTFKEEKKPPITKIRRSKNIKGYR